MIGIRHLLCLVTVGALVGFVGHGQALEQPDAKGKKPPTVMQRKLKHAQDILEGLALNDFARISNGADGLKECAQEASWRVLQTPKYELYSNDFVRHLDEMKIAAKNKNPEAASLAYVETTLTCFKCHRHIREERLGFAPLLPGPEPIAANSR